VEAKKQDKHQKEQDKRNDLGNNHGVKDRSIVQVVKPKPVAIVF
jgi:hypothetical protein